MELVIIFLATVLFVIYAFLIITAESNITNANLTCKKEIALENIKMTSISMNRLVENMKAKNEMDNKKLIKKGKELKKKLDENQKNLELERLASDSRTQEIHGIIPDPCK